MMNGLLGITYLIPPMQRRVLGGLKLLSSHCASLPFFSGIVILPISGSILVASSISQKHSRGCGED